VELHAGACVVITLFWCAAPCSVHSPRHTNLTAVVAGSQLTDCIVLKHRNNTFLHQTWWWLTEAETCGLHSFVCTIQ
jgi:hypothetical protein